MRAALILAVFIASAVLATQTDDLSHAMRHHSSMSDAPHHIEHGRTSNWLLFGVRQCGAQFARELQSQLTVGQVALVEHKSGACVLKTDASISHDQLTAVLMSEQRAGRLERFHRERIAKYTSH